jgi:hypothetical protein
VIFKGREHSRAFAVPMSTPQKFKVTVNLKVLGSPWAKAKNA